MSSSITEGSLEVRRAAPLGATGAVSRRLRSSDKKSSEDDESGQGKRSDGGNPASFSERVDNETAKQQRQQLSVAGGGIGVSSSRKQDEIRKKNNAKWQSNLEQARQFRQKHGHCNIPQSYVVDGVGLNGWLGSQRHAYRKYCEGKPSAGITQERIDQLKEALGEDWHLLKKQWHQNFELLKQYKQTNGHCNVPREYVIDGVELGIWLSKQKYQYQTKSNTGKLTKKLQERRGQLEAVGVEWAGANQTNLNGKSWLSKLELLRQYREQNGHCQVPELYVIDGVKLGSWLQWQRREYKKHSEGTPSSMTAERIDALNAVGADWVSNNRTGKTGGEAKWQSKLELVRQFRQQHGHARVPIKYEIDGVRLGFWLNFQKFQYKKHMQGKPSQLTQERIDGLEAVGCWDIVDTKKRSGEEEKWQSKVELLRQYKQANGHCRVPVKYETIDGVKLGQWLQSQKSYYKKFIQGKTATISQERIDVLNSIGIDWTLRKYSRPTSGGDKEKWQAKVELLRQYKQENGHCRVPVKYETIDGVKLGQWLQSQKSHYKKLIQGKTASISQERIDELNSISIDWSLRKYSSLTSGDDNEMKTARGKRNASTEGHSASLAEAISVGSPHLSPARQSSPNKSRKLNDGSGLTLSLGKSSNNDPSDSREERTAVV